MPDYCQYVHIIIFNKSGYFEISVSETKGVSCIYM